MNAGTQGGVLSPARRCGRHVVREHGRQKRRGAVPAPVVVVRVVRDPLAEVGGLPDPPGFFGADGQSSAGIGGAAASRSGNRVLVWIVVIAPLLANDRCPPFELGQGRRMSKR